MSTEKGKLSDEEIARAQRAQKFYTDAVHLLLSQKNNNDRDTKKEDKDDDEEEFSKLLESYLHTKNSELLPIQQVFQDYQSEGKTLLHVACSAGKVRAAEKILQKCPEVSKIVNLQDKNLYTPIMNATICESLELMKMLIDHGADVKMRNKDGASALNFAAADGSVERMALLIENGADLNITSEAGTPVGWASGKGQAEAVKYLISLKADVNKTGANQIPPVFLAAAASSDETTAALVSAGADVGAIITGNLTLLHICAEGGLKCSVEEIVKTATGLKTAMVVNSDGNLPIHLAAMSKHEDCMRLLLPHSGDPYSSMPIEEAIEKLKKEGTERLAKWHDDCNVSTSKSSPEKERAESENESENKNAPPVTLPEVSEENKLLSLEWKEKGNNFFKKSSYEEAIEAYSEGLKLDPTNHVLYSNRSACYHAIKQYEMCLKDAETCRRLQPQWTKGCFRLATARFALGMYEDAAVAAYEGLQIDGENGELKSLLQRAVKKGQQEHKAKMST